VLLQDVQTALQITLYFPSLEFLQGIDSENMPFSKESILTQEGWKKYLKQEDFY